MLQVLCSTSELDEDGECIAVGDRIERPAGRRRAGTFYGTELDTVEWSFDRYAEITGAETVIIGGRVTAISGEWAPRSKPDSQGRAFALGHPRWVEGDEDLSGWLIALDDDRMRPAPPAPGSGRQPVSSNP